MYICNFIEIGFYVEFLLYYKPGVNLTPNHTDMGITP